MVMKNCVVCGVEFDAKGRAKTCSESCSKKNAQELARIYHLENADKLRDSRRRFNATNAEIFSEKRKQIRQTDPEKFRDRLRRYREANREKLRELERLQYKKDPQKYLAAQRRYRESDPERCKEEKRKRRRNANYRKNVTRILYEEI